MRMSIGYLEPLVFITIFFIFGVTFVHANLRMHILASTCQHGGNPFPVIRLPVVNSVTDSSRHTLRLPALHSQWSRQVYIIHRSITGFLVVQEPTCTHAHEYRLLGASCFFIFGVTFVHANLCMHILASTCQDGGNPFPVIRIPVVNSMTDSLRHTLRLPALHSQWSRQVYIIHRSVTGFLVVQEPTCTHAHEYRLLGASCFFWCLICACKFMPARQSL